MHDKNGMQRCGVRIALLISSAVPIVYVCHKKQLLIPILDHEQNHFQIMDLNVKGKKKNLEHNVRISIPL